MAYGHAIINQITLPNGTPYDVNDAKAFHFLGTTTTDITNAARETQKDIVVIGSSNVVVEVNDAVIYGNDKLMYLCTAVSHTSGDETSTWTNISPTAAVVPVKSVAVDSTVIEPDSNGKVNITAIPASCITAPVTGEAGSEDYSKTYLATGVRVHAPTSPATWVADNVVNKGYVDAAIEALPTPMQFIGTAGTGGTFEPDTVQDEDHLPAAAEANTGWTVKVITDGTYAGVAAEEGDVLISNGTTWLLVPSGDESDGTVTNIDTGVGVIGGPITTTGTIRLDFTDASTGTANHKLADTATTPTYTTGSGRVFAVTVDATEKLAVNVTPGTLATTVSDVSVGNNVVTSLTATTTAPTSPATALDYCTVSNGVLSLNYIVKETASNAVFQQTT